MYGKIVIGTMPKKNKKIIFKPYRNSSSYFRKVNRDLNTKNICNNFKYVNNVNNSNKSSLVSGESIKLVLN